MKNRRRPSLRYIGSGLSVGVSLAAAIFVFYHAGKWLDGKWGTEPLFMIVGVILAIALTFLKMMNDIKTMGKNMPSQDDND